MANSSNDPPRLRLLSNRLARLLASSRSPAASHLAASRQVPRSDPLPPADWRRVLAALPDAAMLLDRQSTVLAFNERAREMFPLISAGIPLSAVSRNPALFEGIGLMRDGASELTIALTERFPVEHTYMATLALVAPPGFAETGPGPELLITFRDLSEANRIDRTRTDFVANASHELRTPLASIIGIIETLQGPARDDPAAREKFLSVMAMQAQRMKRLVDDLMHLTRVEMHAHVMPRDEVDLVDVVEHVRESLEPLAKQEQVTLTAQCCDEPAIVLGDRDELVQVVQNLVHNAIRYGKQGGSVAVRLGRTPVPAGRKGEGGRFLKIEVEDDGPGIADQHLPRLTERFYRIDVAESRQKKGTGLGLAIVKHVLYRHRGELNVKSELGRGSTFSVILPEAPAARYQP